MAAAKSIVALLRLRPCAAFSAAPRRWPGRRYLGGRALAISAGRARVDGAAAAAAPRVHCEWHAWASRFESLRLPAARKLMDKVRLDNVPNVLGYTTKTEKSMVHTEVLAWKAEHEAKVVLVRVGDFYETYGYDAVMLVEHCGLNPMGEKVRAGCPKGNVQQTLDCLTAAGLDVAVFEEEADFCGKGKKNRFLAQVVIPSSPHYVYNRGKDPGDIDFPDVERPPFVALMCGVDSSVTLVTLDVDARLVTVLGGLTADGCRAALQASGVASPLFYFDDSRRQLGFRTDARPATVNANSIRLGKEVLAESRFAGLRPTDGKDGDAPGALLRALVLGAMDPSPATLAEALKVAVAEYLCKKELKVSVNVVGSVGGEAAPRDESAGDSIQRPRPLYITTARELGLMSCSENALVAPLVGYLLPRFERSTASSARWLRKWLLAPPAREAAAAMRLLQRTLRDDDSVRCPAATRLPRDKLVRLLSEEEANASLFRELRGVARATVDLLRQPQLAQPLLALLRHELGSASRAYTAEALEADVSALLARIDAVVAAKPGDGEDDANTAHARIPDDFFTKNEGKFRGALRRDAAPALSAAYAAVENAAGALKTAVDRDFADGEIIDYCGLNNVISIILSKKKKPAAVSSAVDDDGDGDGDDVVAVSTVLEIGVETPPDPQTDLPTDPALNPVVFVAAAAGPTVYHEVHDRRRKAMPNRRTTEAVDFALRAYVDACDAAVRTVSDELKRLCRGVVDHDLDAAIAAQCVTEVATAAFEHATAANERGWGLAEESDGPINLVGLVPYWLPSEVAVPNDVRLDRGGVAFLTGPNTAGKSTLLRSVAAAALLSSCGLRAPLRSGSEVPHLDGVFARAALGDAPLSGKSAYQREMDDVALVLRECTTRSMVLVDELGRGTSADEGAAIGAAIIEELLLKRLPCVFATHLHEIVMLLRPLGPEPGDRLALWRMGADAVDAESPRPDFKLQRGVCTNSLAIETARRAGVPAHVCARARAFEVRSRRDRELGTAARAADVATAGCAATSDEYTSDVDASNVAVRPPAAEASVAPGDLAASVEAVLRAHARDGRTVVRVEPGGMPPPALAAKSCIYALVVDAGAGVYVGETDSIGERLRKHRKKWPGAVAFAVPLEDKSHARRIEASVQRRLDRLGVSLLSAADASNVNFALKPEG